MPADKIVPAKDYFFFFLVFFAVVFFAFFAFLAICPSVGSHRRDRMICRPKLTRTRKCTADLQN